MWLLYAVGSALFAGLTSILAKCGIRKTDSTVATAIRTIIVLIFAWVMVFVVGSQGTIASIPARSLVFLGLSGLATGASWLCYFYALQRGPIDKVVPIDKSSTVMTILLAALLLGESVTLTRGIGVVLIAAGTFLMIEKKGGVQKEENGWMPDFDELERMNMSRVKLMWTNYPNMPTGANATPELYRKLVDFARRKDIVIVNDNPYSFILNEHPISILSIPGAKECCIEFNSMSKSHNMPGWRIGMLASNADFVQWILKVKSNIDSGMFRAMQLAAATALEAEQDWYDGNNANYRNRRQLAGEIMHTLGCTYDENQVGMFLWGKIPDSCTDVEELTEHVLHKARVFITPGFIFGSNGKRYIRISLCCKDNKLAEALKRIKDMK